MIDLTSGNLTEPRGASTERLFYSPSFVLGFGDARAARPFRYPDRAGPNPHKRSGQIAYERGRQFAILWGDRPVTDLSAMLAALADFHIQRAIL